MDMLMTDGLVEMDRDEMLGIEGGVLGVDDLIVIGVCVGVVAIVGWWAYNRNQTSVKVAPTEDPVPDFGPLTLTSGK